jgi:hypothetical protein
VSNTVPNRPLTPERILQVIPIAGDLGSSANEKYPTMMPAARVGAKEEGAYHRAWSFFVCFEFALLWVPFVL